MTSEEVLQAADSHPFNLEHNCASLTSLFAAAVQPADMAAQQQVAGAADDAPLLQQPPLGGFGVPPRQDLFLTAQHDSGHGPGVVAGQPVAHGEDTAGPSHEER